MTTIQVVVRNPSGLHARPAALFVRTAGKFGSKITIGNPAAGKGPVDAKSILSVLTLGVSSGTEIEVSAEGDDAEAALAAIREAVESGLGEDPGAVGVTVATAASQTLDPTVAWDALVIGGGATGAGLLRDLARRGMRTLLVDRSDLGTGTSGRYHGLLHSGGRYVARDADAARECIVENRVVRRIAAFAVEDTGGYFVATPDDPDDYVDAFPALCAASDVDCVEVDVAEVLRTNPTLNPRIRRAFAVPDAAVEPWPLIEGNVADAAALGSAALPYHRVVGFDRSGERLLAARVVDVRSGTEYRVMAGQLVSAAGAWGGQVAAMAGAKLTMAPGKGTMLVFNQRMTDAVINRCHKSADGDIMVPVGTVAILGTTDIHVADPDD